MSFATLDREQSRRLDQLAVEEYGMTGLVLMENAGRGAVDVLCHEAIEGPVTDKPVLICCGKGNNAGDGFVMARHLDLRGYDVRVLAWAVPDELRGDAAANFNILQNTDVPITVCGDDFDQAQFDEELSHAAWVVDALLGTGARGEPRAPFDAIIERINATAAAVLAVDLPSGLDCDTGRPATQTIRAKLTCTFAAAKPGLIMPTAEPYVGQVHVVDIGAPRKLIERMLG